ncbi:hypothetical protein C8R47DRAFT_1083879 [Mycena vitilis]|nr:hypothetical protein C8R47DRAFT_1083879 [Mycena vitilis]
MTPTPLRFESKDMLNSALVRPDGTVEYTTHTELDLYDHKRTTIKGRSGLRAIIDWTAKTFTIGGKERLWTQLKKNMGNPLSSKFRVWHWSDTRYTVRYAKDHDGEMRYTVRRTQEDGKWEEKEEGAGADLARLSPVVVHFFNPPEPAVLSLAPELDELEGIFLILVLLASETKRCDARTYVRTAIARSPWPPILSVAAYFCTAAGAAAARQARLSDTGGSGCIWLSLSMPINGAFSSLLTVARSPLISYAGNVNSVE